MRSIKQHEAKLRRYVDLFTLAPDGYLVTHLNGMIQEANQAAAQLLSVPPHVLAGRPLALFVVAEERRAFCAQLVRLPQLDRVQAWDIRLQPSKGVPFDASLTVTVARDSTGHATGLRWLLRDITVRKGAEAAEQPALQPASAAEIQFRGLIEAAPDAIVIVSRAGVITLINRQTEALFGYTQDELLGQPVEILLPARLRATHHDHRAQYAANPHTRPMGAGRELVGHRKDDSEFPVEISLSALEAAGDILIISIIRDISAQKHAEEQHQQLLAREQAARAEAEAAVRTRDELFAIISHDLKNPVAVIKGYAQLLQRHLATADLAVDGRIARSLKIIDAEATQMTSQIDLRPPHTALWSSAPGRAPSPISDISTNTSAPRCHSHNASTSVTQRVVGWARLWPAYGSSVRYWARCRLIRCAIIYSVVILSAGFATCFGTTSWPAG